MDFEAQSGRACGSFPFHQVSFDTRLCVSATDAAVWQRSGAWQGSLRRLEAAAARELQRGTRRPLPAAGSHGRLTSRLAPSPVAIASFDRLASLLAAAAASRARSECRGLLPYEHGCSGGAEHLPSALVFSDAGDDALPTAGSSLTDVRAISRLAGAPAVNSSEA